MPEVIDKTIHWSGILITILVLLGIAGKLERIEHHTMDIKIMLQEASK